MPQMNVSVSRLHIRNPLASEHFMKPFGGTSESAGMH